MCSVKVLRNAARQFFSAQRIETLTAIHQSSIDANSVGKTFATWIKTDVDCARKIRSILSKAKEYGYFTRIDMKTIRAPMPH